MSIWSFPQINKLVNQKYQLTLNEGNTPLEKYIINGGINFVVIKREDKNPNGSFKDRSLAFQISKKLEMGIKELVISSTGNAAISAIAYAKLSMLKLHVFISPKIPKEKMMKIKAAQNDNIRIYISNKAKSDAIKLSKKKNIINLRGSIDYDAIIGYKTISYELAKQNPEIDAIFVPVSSGTNVIGIYKGYSDLMRNKEISIIPQIHIVQTERIYPIAKVFDKEFERKNTSIALAITDKVAHRKQEVLNIIKKTNGFGWIISDDMIRNAIRLAKILNINNNSPNSNLSLAGYLKSKAKGYKFNNPCLIFSGL